MQSPGNSISFRIAMLVGALLCMWSPARAVIGPHQTFLDDPPEEPPRNDVCLFSNCDTTDYPETWGATQSANCSYAGLGEPARFTSTTNALLQQPIEDFGYKMFPGDADAYLNEWPGANHGIQDIGAGEGPLQGFHSGTSGSSAILDPNNIQVQMQNQLFGSFNFRTPTGGVPDSMQRFVHQQVNVGGTSHTSLMFENYSRGLVQYLAVQAQITLTPNYCRVVLLPTDPHYTRTGRHGGNSWGEGLDDQWAIKRVGLTEDEYSAWHAVPENAAPVIVAIIDSGLDWHHRDIDADSIWRNAAEDPDNGIDDDGNGYVDDVVGWNFVGRTNKPWDFDGHGTVVAGIISAAHNDIGIAGINPNVKVMVLKAVNNFGTARASYIAEAIVYAVDNGAKVINISVGGAHISEMEQAAIDFAAQEGVLVVAAAGNDGVELDDFGPGGNDHVLTVGATYFDDRAAGFSNFGDKVDLVAPGVDVLSLRARYTDANFRPDGVANGDDEYELGSFYVGEDNRYLRVSGTSFSTPIVTGVASLLLSKDPKLTADQVRHRLISTATDIELPGKDKYGGHGMVNAQAALGVDIDFLLTAEISGIDLVQTETSEAIHVKGTIDADQFKRAWMQIGPGDDPGQWRFVGQKRKYPIRDGVIGKIPISQFAGADKWQIVVNVEHKNGIVKRARYPVNIK